MLFMQRLITRENMMKRIRTACAAIPRRVLLKISKSIQKATSAMYSRKRR